MDALEKYVKEHPDAFLREIASHFGCGKDAVARALKKLGFTRKKKQKIYKERDESKRKIFVDKINETPEDQLVFLDESGIDTFLYKEYGRAKRGEKIMAEVAGKKFKRQSIVAAQCGKAVLAPFGYSGTCDAKLFKESLNKYVFFRISSQILRFFDCFLYRNRW